MYSPYSLHLRLIHPTTSSLVCYSLAASFSVHMKHSIQRLRNLEHLSLSTSHLSHTLRTNQTTATVPNSNLCFHLSDIIVLYLISIYLLHGLENSCSRNPGQSSSSSHVFSCFQDQRFLLLGCENMCFRYLD